MKIQLTEFSKRQFKEDFGGTKIKISEEQFMKEFNVNYIDNLHDGYADFCKLLILPNWTDIKTGTLPITDTNKRHLKSDYVARNEKELPVLTRGFEFKTNIIDFFKSIFGIKNIPTAEYLVFVLYDREQLVKEAGDNEVIDEDLDFGIVAILAQMSGNEEPMKPSTMLRNALGIEEGGSGVSLDRDEYMKSVDFWKKNATIK
tara:strand:- start:15572 stop:16177 length:606 start_codon:yes stop_codon:yes gene_type:complete